MPLGHVFDNVSFVAEVARASCSESDSAEHVTALQRHASHLLPGAQIACKIRRARLCLEGSWRAPKTCRAVVQSRL